MNLTMFVIFNNTCNLNCSFCYENKTDMKNGIHCTPDNRESFQRFLTKYKDINNLSILGGESFIDSHELNEFLKFIVIENESRSEDLQIQVSFITNGTIYLPWLKDFEKIIKNVQISIDGGKSCNNSCRKYISNREDSIGSYDAAVLNLRRYYNDGLRVNVHSVITWKTLNLWMKSRHEFFKDVPSDVMICTEMEHSFERNAIKSIIARYKYLKASMIARLSGEHRDFKISRSGNGRPGEGKSSTCTLGRRLLGVELSTGDIYTCQEMVGNKEYCVGNISNDNPFDVDKLSKYLKLDNISNFRIRHIPKRLSDTILISFPMHFCILDNKTITGSEFIIPFRSVILYLIGVLFMDALDHKSYKKRK